MAETRKIAAILVADVVGYSRLAGADEDRTLARLRGLRSDLIDPAIAAHRGRVVKRTGDGSIVEFRSVVDAVRCAIEVQSGLIERNAGVPPERRIESRIGIHLGDVVEEADGDLMGDGVNIAARLEGVAKPGAICVSEDAYRQVRGRLDLAISDLGLIQLKNIADPIRVYSLEVGKPTQAKLPEKPPEREKRPQLPLVSAGIAALLILVAAAWYLLAANRSVPVASNAPPPLAAARLSIVVLPFANLSGDPAQDYLADAVTDQLTTAITRLRGSFMIAQTTALAYKGKPVDAKAIGRELNVRYVLEGSVQPTGNQVRVNAQLIDAESGAHLWAEQFDTPRADLLQMQDDIVTRLARSIYLQLPKVEIARLKRTPAANPDAEDLALQCQAVFLKSEVTILRTDSPCELALAADPNNVRALTWSAMQYLPSRGRGHAPNDDLDRADGLVSRALSWDPNYAPAHLVKAFALQSQFRLDEAIAEDRRAFGLDPSLVDAYWHAGFVMRRLGEFQTSLEYIDKAIRLSPRDPFRASWYADKAGTHLALKQYDQAIEWARHAIEITPNEDVPYLYLIVALALTGQESEAHEALQRYLSNPGAGRTMATWNSRRAQYVDERTDPRYVDYWDRLMEGLRKAGLPEE
jgi:class 3 adenylate cyclase/TolB-like protein/Tfp pilus assembly protein PilF